MEFKAVKVIETGGNKSVAEQEAELLAKHEAQQAAMDVSAQEQPNNLESPPAQEETQ